MNRRKWLRILLLAAITAAGFAAFIWWTSRPRISQQTADRIQEGMTEEQVIAIVGLPPGVYCSERSRRYILRNYGEQAANSGIIPVGTPANRFEHHIWIVENRCLEVSFQEGRADWAHYYETPISFWDWVRGVVRI
jgi:hypothetical protein